MLPFKPSAPSSLLYSNSHQDLPSLHHRGIFNWLDHMQILCRSTPLVSSCARQPCPIQRTVFHSITSHPPALTFFPVSSYLIFLEPCVCGGGGVLTSPHQLTTHSTLNSNMYASTRDISVTRARNITINI